ncbi:MAG: chemotaxis protein CheW [Magnetococcales bacterium]|nr:chemotaxis protein CheW [Magnetococcales bacterium]
MMKLLTFKLDGETFGVDIDEVQEVLEYMPLTAIPRVDAFVKGVIRLRGVVVPVVDLRQRLDRSPIEPSRDSAIIILDLPWRRGGRFFGAVVDGVDEVMDMPPQALLPPPRANQSPGSGFIRSMGRQGDKFIMILDTRALFTFAPEETTPEENAPPVVEQANSSRLEEHDLLLPEEGAGALPFSPSARPAVARASTASVSGRGRGGARGVASKSAAGEVADDCASPAAALRLAAEPVPPPEAVLVEESLDLSESEAGDGIDQPRAAGQEVADTSAELMATGAEPQPDGAAWDAPAESTATGAEPQPDGAAWDAPAELTATGSETQLDAAWDVPAESMTATGSETQLDAAWDAPAESTTTTGSETRLDAAWDAPAESTTTTSSETRLDAAWDTPAESTTTTGAETRLDAAWDTPAESTTTTGSETRLDAAWDTPAEPAIVRHTDLDGNSRNQVAACLSPSMTPDPLARELVGNSGSWNDEEVDFGATLGDLTGGLASGVALNLGETLFAAGSKAYALPARHHPGAAWSSREENVESEEASPPLDPPLEGGWENVGEQGGESAVSEEVIPQEPREEASSAGVGTEPEELVVVPRDLGLSALAGNLLFSDGVSLMSPQEDVPLDFGFDNDPEITTPDPDAAAELTVPADDANVAEVSEAVASDARAKESVPLADESDTLESTAATLPEKKNPQPGSRK